MISVTERVEPEAVDTLLTGAWILTLNARREIVRDGAIAVRDGVIVEVGKRAAMRRAYRPAELIDEPDSIVIPGMTMLSPRARCPRVRAPCRRCGDSSTPHSPRSPRRTCTCSRATPRPR
jgi:hypothetical protein